MSSRQGMSAALDQSRAAGKDVDTHDLLYRATLATLLRIKRKDRVPPRQKGTLFDYDTLIEDRLPKYGRKLDPDNPPAHPYGCKPDCETCFTQTFPARVSVSDKTARAHVRKLAKTINNDRQALRTYLLGHADYIVTKWRKSKTKRSDLLSNVCFDMETSSLEDLVPHSVSLYNEKWAIVHLIHEHNRDGMRDFDAREFLKGSERADDPATLALAPHVLNILDRKALEMTKDAYQTTWLLPYLDVESLIEEPLLLLALLHARTAYSPEDWMMFDNSQLKAAEGFEVLVPEFNSHYVTMTGDKYGTDLEKWDMERCHHWEIVGYQKAVHILTAQCHMMRFLRCTVEGLLQDKPHPSEQPPKSHPKWESLVQNGFFSFGSSSAVSIRASANQPFSAPPVFDPTKTFELVQSMYEASVDELDLAQTNPAYVQCLVRGLEASIYFKAQGSGPEGRWGFIMDELICNFYRRFIWWRQMLKECQIMLDKYQQYLALPNSENRKAYEDSLFVIHDIAIEHMAQQLLLVQYSMPFQPGFVRNFEYERTSDKTQPMIIEDQDAFHTDKLFWSIRGLGFDRDRLFTLDPSYQFRVLDYELSHASTKERKRINEQLLRSLSEIAVVDEIRTSIACDRGWNRQPSSLGKRHIPEFRRDFIDRYQKKLSLPELIKNGGLPQALRVFQKDAPWPTGKVDEAWLRAAASSREHLNKLWSRFRAGLKSQQVRKEFSSTFIEEDQVALSAALRPNNIRVIEEEEEESLRSTIKSRTPPRSSQPVLWPTEEPAKFTAPAAKSKKKTRPCGSGGTGSEGSSETVPATPAQPPEETDPLPLSRSIFVKPENLGLFQAMFTTPKAQMRSYSWVHFTQAMVDAGCSVTQGSGSAVHFRSEHGVIVFHRPHPEPAIAQEIFIAMGKRLKKRFGWTEETFHCERASE